MSRSLLRVLWLSAGVLVSLASHATTVIDQPNFNAVVQINGFSPIGQSFIAMAPNVESIELKIQNMNLTGYLDARNVTVVLLSGTGFGGSTIASSTVDAAAIIGSENTDWTTSWVSFNLGNVAVTQGGAYTFGVIDTTPRFGVQYNIGDVYSGGSAIHADIGIPDYGNGTGNDLAFRVTAVPEPAGSALFALGLVSMGLLLRRRH